MKEKVSINSPVKDFSQFVRIPEARKNAINNALKTPIKKNLVVNYTANFLHPQVQYLKIREVIELSRDERCYILYPDSSHGTGKLSI